MKLCWLSVVSLVLAANAHGEEAPATSSAFFRTEIIVFTRDAPTDANPVEQFPITTAPQLQSPLAAFIATPRQSAYALESSDDLTPFRGQPRTTELEPRNAASATVAPGPITPPPTPAEQARAKLEALEARWQQESLQWLPPTQLGLTREKNAIARAAGLHLVWHGAWIQPVPDRDRDPNLPMLLQVGEQLGDVYQVEGFVGVTRGRFLHFDVGLWLHDPVTGGYVSLEESRRLRSGELNYFDHPRLGMLVRIDPLELPEDLSAELAALAKAKQ